MQPPESMIPKASRVVHSGGTHWKEDVVRQIVGVLLLLASVILLGWGVEAQDSLGSRISVFLSTAPTNRTIWHVLTGAGCLSVGLGLLTLPKLRAEK